MFALFCLSFAAHGGTIATVNCSYQNFPSSYTGSVTATCSALFNTTPISSSFATAYARATAGYGILSARSASMWSLGGGLQPTLISSAGFDQAAVFTGSSGNGTLVFSHISVGGGILGYNATASFTGYTPQYLVPISIPINFGTPVSLYGSVSAYGSDSDVTEIMDTGSFAVLDSNGNTIRTFSGLALFPGAIYNVQDGSATNVPEPALWWMVGVCLVGITYRKWPAI